MRLRCQRSFAKRAGNVIVAATAASPTCNQLLNCPLLAILHKLQYQFLQDFETPHGTAGGRTYVSSKGHSSRLGLLIGTAL